MKNGLLKWIAGLSVAVCQSVSAVPITDTVIVGTQEWAQVNLFTNVSWNDLNAQCPGGVCTSTSSINGYDLDDWTWASVDTVQSLFNSFTGGATVAPGLISEFDSTWAPAFMALFTPTGGPASPPFGPFANVVGLTPTVSSISPDRRLAPVMADCVAVGGACSSFILDTADTSYSVVATERFSFLGAWFLRDAAPTPAPVPATLTLFGLGLASLWITRRKRGAKV